MRVTDFSLFLMIKHPAADLGGLPSTLRLQAARVWKAGSSRATPKGTPLPGIYRESYCGLEIPQVADLSLEEAIAHALDHLSSNQHTLDEVSATGGKPMLVVRWRSDGNTGAEFGPELLARLAEMRIAPGLDVYGESNPAA